MYRVTSVRYSLYRVTSVRYSLYRVTSVRYSLYPVTTVRQSTAPVNVDAIYVNLTDTVLISDVTILFYCQLCKTVRLVWPHSTSL